MERHNISNKAKRVEEDGRLGIELGVSPKDYTLENERAININPNSSSRQWMYQVCSAFGWFATGREENTIRPKELDEKYYRGICKRIFNRDIYPNIDYTNGFTGNIIIPPQLKHVLIINGKEDPWKWAGYLNENDSSNDLLIKVIKCKDCAHCIDLYNSTKADPPELSEARSIRRKTIVRWMAHTDNPEYS